MPRARLIATVPAPLTGAGPPELVHSLLVQRSGTELAVRDPAGTLADRRFPAPWPLRYGTATVSPAGDLAVFAGVHAIVAVDTAGARRWELRHGCWSAAVCDVAHASFEEYAGDRDHAYADSGSSSFTPGGGLLWAHVRQGDEEEWLVIDPNSGTVLGRAPTGTVGSNSHHFPHPDPSRMGLTVGEGEEDSPVLWGHWNGEHLSVVRFPAEILLGVSPSGDRFLTTDVSQGTLYLHGSTVRELDSEECWDFEAAVVSGHHAVIGTEQESDTAAHRLIDLDTLTAGDPIIYPFPVTGTARTAAPGSWYTVAADQSAVHLWGLEGAV